MKKSRRLSVVSRIDATALATAVVTALVTAGSIVSAPAVAGDLAFAAEVDSCLAAVNDRVGLQGAERVRHLVTDSKRTAIGYALSIETSVFSADSERRYSIRCVARGDNTPLKLTIDGIET